jgi:alkylated DNA repair dioxygenase AlkB
MIPDQTVLFAASGPEGFAYAADFLTAAEEASLLADIGTVSFSSFEMRGVVAKRRVAFFGHSYGRSVEREIPPFLESLRSRLAIWAGVQPDAFAMALINEYEAGSPIGWHRDAPQYDIVAGVSLMSPCRMKFRPYSKSGGCGSRACATSCRA